MEKAEGFAQGHLHCSPSATLAPHLKWQGAGAWNTRTDKSLSLATIHQPCFGIGGLSWDKGGCMNKESMKSSNQSSGGVEWRRTQGRLAMSKHGMKLQSEPSYFVMEWNIGDDG